jgi:hypothetical protein
MLPLLFRKSSGSSLRIAKKVATPLTFHDDRAITKLATEPPVLVGAKTTFDAHTGDAPSRVAISAMCDVNAIASLKIEERIPVAMAIIRPATNGFLPK